MHGLFGHPYRTWTKEHPTRSAKRDFDSLAPPPEKKRSSWTRHLKPWKSPSSGNCSPSPGAESAGNVTPEGSILHNSSTGPLFWPRDLLPARLPQARIWTWGYDVDINNLLSATSQLSVFRHADALLSDLADLDNSLTSKPVHFVFVAHSLGGLVVKDALNKSRSSRTYVSKIYNTTGGVCFLGTPHRGSATATLGRIAFDISKLFFQQPATHVLRSLEVNSEVLDRIGQGFSEILVDQKLKIHSFSEEIPTKGIMVVNNFSSSIGDGLETRNSIPANHEDMTKFDSDSDVGFTRICAVLTRWENELYGSQAGIPLLLSCLSASKSGC